ncbi:unnamed protein product [Parajaminaea phylloscopi]
MSAAKVDVEAHEQEPSELSGAAKGAANGDLDREAPTSQAVPETGCKAEGPQRPTPPDGGAVIPRLRERITVPALRLHLLLISFGTGLLDAATYSDFGIFASNQTGNTIIVLVEAVERSRGASPAPLLAVGISLASFLFFGVLFGQIGVSPVVGPCTRGWLLFSTFIQAALILLAAVLVQTGVLSTTTRDPKDTTLLVLLLAASSGIQVAMAKSVGVKEVPTAMLTSPYMDLLTDPHLTTRSLTSSVVASRNLRLGYLFFFATGTVVGAIAKVHSGTTTVLWLSCALRIGNDIYILLAPGKPPDHGQEREPTEDS